MELILQPELIIRGHTLLPVRRIVRHPKRNWTDRAFLVAAVQTVNNTIAYIPCNINGDEFVEAPGSSDVLSAGHLIEPVSALVDAALDWNGIPGDVPLGAFPTRRRLGRPEPKVVSVADAHDIVYVPAHIPPLAVVEALDLRLNPRQVLVTPNAVREVNGITGDHLGFRLSLSLHRVKSYAWLHDDPVPQLRDGFDDRPLSWPHLRSVSEGLHSRVATFDPCSVEPDWEVTEGATPWVDQKADWRAIEHRRLHQAAIDRDTAVKRTKRLPPYLTIHYGGHVPQAVFPLLTNSSKFEQWERIWIEGEMWSADDFEVPD